ncbi:helix-turn-helix domain-containing protein [Flavobacterium koreense]
MLEHFEQIEKNVVNKIYKLFLEKFNGNNSRFANASDCSETTVRRVFRNKQRMTLNLLLRFCNALEIDIKDVFDNIKVTQKDN